MNRRPIRSRPKLTEHEPSASFNSTERTNGCRERANLQPRGICSRGASERYERIVISLSCLTLSFAVRIACGAWYSFFLPVSLFISFLFCFSPRESRGFSQSRSRSVAARSSVGGLRMTSCDRSPRNVPALSFVLPHALRALSLDRVSSLALLRALRRLSLAPTRLCPLPRSCRLVLYRVACAREKESARDSRLAVAPNRAREKEIGRYTACASAKNVYTYGCYLRGGKSNPPRAQTSAARRKKRANRAHLHRQLTPAASSS